MEHVLFENVPSEWIDVLLDDSCIGAFAAAVRGMRGRPITPAAELVLEAFRVCPLSELNVVIIGQDPYPNPGHAAGMAFASRATTQPASLRAISGALMASGLITEPLDTRLDTWAAQGVLLLNRAFTTAPRKSGAHGDLWHPYTDALVRHIARLRPHVTFVCWGKVAQGATVGLPRDTRVLQWGHPSPLTTANRLGTPDAFIHCPHFAQLTHIDWHGGAVPEPRVPRHQLYLASDGGACKNGKAGASATWAYVIRSTALDRVGSGIVPPAPGAPPSNNRGELLGLYNGLKAVAALPLGPYKHLHVYVDSLYALGAATTNEVNKNADLITPLRALLATYPIPYTISHVKAHRKEAPPRDSPEWLPWHLNDRADRAATAAKPAP